MSIIHSLLDTDLYKLTQGQMVFNQFPEAIVEYEFVNRGAPYFPTHVIDDFVKEIDSMAGVGMSEEEFRYLNSIRFLKPTFLEWLRHYRFDPTEINIERGSVCTLDAVPGMEKLKLRITGPWYRTIYWEVPLMAALSELNFQHFNKSCDWEERIQEKSDRLTSEGVHWIDFGTRRRFSLEVQDKVVLHMKSSPFFRGTSNILLAMKHGVKAQGTIAHETHQAMQAKYGVMMSNQMALDHWSREYGGDLGVMLPDTLTTPFFMKHLSRRDAKLYDGARQDSGDLVSAANDYINTLYRLDVDPMSKTLVPSDSLTDETAIAFARHFRGKVKGVTAGIGTFLTNDCGVRPLNMVIKMIKADFGFGMVDVVKLSDVKGKYTGNPDRISVVRKELAYT